MAAFDDRAVNAEVDGLYQLPLDQFVKSRNDLAKRVGGEHAASIRRLPKPNVLAWALNQLYWTKKESFDRLVTAAARLRATQAEALLGKSADLRAAGDAHREAVGEALRQAAQILEAAGHAATPDAIRELTGALEALPWKEPGRLVRPPAASGFEALAGLPVSRAAAPSKSKTASEREKPDRGKERRAPTTGDRGGTPVAQQAARRERAAALKAAREAARAARREEAQAATRLEQTDQELEAARRGETAAREALREAERVRASAEEERRAAAAALDRARQGTAEAADRLAGLERG